MLTARTTEDDRLLGLDLGADDYVIKPFSPRELVARVRAVLRRVQHTPAQEAAPPTIRRGPLLVDLRRHEVRLAGTEVPLTPSEFDLLLVLAREPGRVFSRQELLQRAFGFDYDGLERTVDVHVMNLRRKLEPDPANPRFLHTVYGVGYRFAEETDADERLP
jgi:DNA-binding response OmpR family regulator